MLTHTKAGALQIFLTWLISILHLFVYWRYIITYDFEVYDFYYLFSANSIFLLLGLVLFHLRVIKGLRYVLVMATLVQIAGVCWQYYSIGEFLDQLIPVVVLAGLSFWWMKKEPAMYVKKTTSDVPVSKRSVAEVLALFFFSAVGLVVTSVWTGIFLIIAFSVPFIIASFFHPIPNDFYSQDVFYQVVILPFTVLLIWGWATEIAADRSNYLHFSRFRAIDTRIRSVITRAVFEIRRFLPKRLESLLPLLIAILFVLLLSTLAGHYLAIVLLSGAFILMLIEGYFRYNAAMNSGITIGSVIRGIILFQQFPERNEKARLGGSLPSILPQFFWLLVLLIAAPTLGFLLLLIVRFDRVVEWFDGVSKHLHTRLSSLRARLILLLVLLAGIIVAIAVTSADNYYANELLLLAVIPIALYARLPYLQNRYKAFAAFFGSRDILNGNWAQYKYNLHSRRSLLGWNIQQPAASIIQVVLLLAVLTAVSAYNTDYARHTVLALTLIFFFSVALVIVIRRLGREARYEILVLAEASYTIHYGFGLIKNQDFHPIFLLFFILLAISPLIIIPRGAYSLAGLRKAWFLAMVPFLGLVYVILRYREGKKIRAEYVLFLRSFHEKHISEVFAHLVYPVCLSYGSVVGLSSALQPESEVNRRINIWNAPRLGISSDSDWKEWISGALRDSWLVIIDIKTLTESVRWEIVTSLTSVDLNHIIFIAHKANSGAMEEVYRLCAPNEPGDPVQLHVLHYDPEAKNNARAELERLVCDLWWGKLKS
jgi:hypothetical protein